jgi:REP element-mobilizing transposase RayT
MKPNVYTQLLVQFVFATKYREHLLHRDYRSEVWKYISGIITEKGHKSMIVNGVTDHVHILVGLKPYMSISDLVREIKRSSSIFINEKKWIKKTFQWQEGYGAFSYCESHLKFVYKYIENQEEHHRAATFKDEYLTLLKNFNIEYKEEYLFNWI